MPEIADQSRRGFSMSAARKRETLQSATGGAPAPVTVTSAQAPVAPIQGSATMLIRNGHVIVRVDSLERAIDGVRQLAISLGGSLGNISMNTGERQVRSASLELKVPASRFDQAMTGMSPFGKVEVSNAFAQDVGEEFVDITARVANAKRLESRLIDLLATRTGKLEDVLAVERELARVREEIERHEGRIRYLSTRVATSTIMAELHEKAPLVASTPGTNVLGNAFVQMWRNFVAFVAAFIEALGILVPLAVMAWLGFRGWIRWRSQRAAAAGPTALAS
jgi:hypothetical protein